MHITMSYAFSGDERSPNDIASTPSTPLAFALSVASLIGSIAL